MEEGDTKASNQSYQVPNPKGRETQESQYDQQWDTPSPERRKRKLGMITRGLAKEQGVSAAEIVHQVGGDRVQARHTRTTQSGWIWVGHVQESARVADCFRHEEHRIRRGSNIRINNSKMQRGSKTKINQKKGDDHACDSG